MENGFVNVLFLKSICNHLEIVNFDQEENRQVWVTSCVTAILSRWLYFQTNWIILKVEIFQIVFKTI